MKSEMERDILKVLVDEYRAGKLGRFTLEMPEETEQPAASE